MSLVSPAPGGRTAPETPVELVGGLRRRIRRAPVGPAAGLLAAALVAQALVAPHLAPPGAAPDLLVVAAAVVAAVAAPPVAVAFAFAAGLAADLFLATPFGLSAAAFTAVARAGAALPPPRRVVLVAPRVGASAFVSGALVLVGAAALGDTAAPSPAALGLLARASLLAAALSPPVFVAVRHLAAGGARRPPG